MKSIMIIIKITILIKKSSIGIIIIKKSIEKIKKIIIFKTIKKRYNELNLK